MSGEENLSFEQCLERLEAIVKEVEGGNLDLDTAITRFTEGMELVRKCRVFLTAAERKLSLLIEDRNGRLVLSPTNLAKGNEDGV
ncbi:MAG: exodeoxyribonuclease VII small subunit [Bacillota bacterium]